jgi:hypothetical protein
MPQSVVLKIDQAKKHLDTLEKEVRSYLSRKPFAVVPEEEPHTGDLVYKVRINESVPVQWSAIVGDIIHNLRSALDHVAYELVQANGQPATRETAFRFLIMRPNSKPIFHKSSMGPARPQSRPLKASNPIRVGTTISGGSIS